MDESFVREPMIAKARMRELNARRNGPGFRRLASQGFIYFGTSAALLVVPADWRVLVPLMVANSLIQFAMFGMLHEACHRTAFASKGWSDFAGWIAALAQPMSPALMRAFHYEHHRHTHELDKDPELAGLALMVKWPRGVVWLGTMTGVALIGARLYWTLFAAITPQGVKLWTKVLPFVRPEARRGVAWEARALTLLHASAVVLAILVWPPIWRVYLGMVLGHTLLAWYTTCEHRGLPEGADVPILAKTRSLRTSAWLRWLLWNMPFHAEHHGWPSVPFHALPQLHQEAREHLVHRERPLHLHLHGGRERQLKPAA